MNDHHTLNSGDELDDYLTNHRLPRKKEIMLIKPRKTFLSKLYRHLCQTKYKCSTLLMLCLIYKAFGAGDVCVPACFTAGISPATVLK
jgi:hypothetical protein